MNLMKQQELNDIKPILGSFRDKSNSEREIEKKAVDIGLSVRSFRIKGRLDIKGANEIRRYVREEQIDIVHCHGYKANILSGMLPFRYGKTPCITTFHGWTATGGFSKLWAYEWLDAIMAKRADRVVVVSKAMRENRKIRVLGLKPLVIYNGIADLDEPGMPGDNAWEPGPSNDKKIRIVSIGRLSKEKAFDVLLKTAYRLKNQWNYEVLLTIAGDGPEKAKLIGMCEDLGLNGNVFLQGYRKDACRELRQHDVFVMSSVTEGMPVTLLEAMRVGIPIVATSVGGIPEALDRGSCGVLAEPGNDQDLAEKIVRIHEDASLKAEMSKRARIRFLSEFTVKKMEEEYRSAYMELVGTGRA